MAMQVAKVILSSGKVAYLRNMKIVDTERAAQIVSPLSNGDSNLMQVMMQKELLKGLLVATQDSLESEMKKLSPTQKEDIDSILTLSEYSQLLQVIGKMSGADEAKKPVVAEFMTLE